MPELSRLVKNAPEAGAFLALKFRPLAAGLGVARSVRRLEARAASAALDGVGVKDRKAALHQVFDVVDLSSFQQGSALLVDQNLDAIRLDFDVALFPVAGDCHPVLVAGAASADDKYT